MNNILKEYGTLMYTDMGMILGDVPAEYFTKNLFPSEKLRELDLGWVADDLYRP